MKMKTTEALCFNFVTGSYDTPGEFDSDEKAQKYLPQDAASQNIYSVYRSMGRGIPYAMLEVLQLHTSFKPGGGNHE